MEQFGVDTRASAHNESESKQTSRFNVGRAVLEVCDCTRGLADKLAVRADGRTFTPVQLIVPQKNTPSASWTQVMQFLMSPRPIGGYDDLIATSKAAADERAANALSDRLGSLGEAMTYAQLLAQTRDAGLEERQAIEADVRPRLERFQKADVLVRKYQEESVRAASKTLSLKGLLKAVIGDTVSLPEAIKAFNDRETLGLEIAARQAVSDVLGRTVSMCEQVLGGLEATRSVVLAGAQAAQANLTAAGQQAALAGRMADYMVASCPVIETVCDANTDAAYLTELIAEARRTGGETVTAKAHALASRHVRARLNGVDVLGFIRLEAATSSASGQPIAPASAPITIANHLVDLVRRVRPGARFVNGAKPRTFVLQVAWGERPPFNHTGLTPARYRQPVDEIAFVRVDADVALNELQAVVEGEDDFIRAEARREFFVLEELADAWQVRTPHGDDDDLRIDLPNDLLHMGGNGNGRVGSRE